MPHQPADAAALVASAHTPHQPACTAAADDDFRSLANSAPIILWVTEANGYCSFLSAGWHALTGQKLEQSLGLGWTEAVHPDDRAEACTAFLQAQSSRSGYGLEHRLLRADGSWIWVIDAGQPRYSPTGYYLGHVGSVTDIHARRLAEDALRRSEARYRKLLGSIDQGFCVIQMLFDANARATDYRFIEVNDMFKRQTGLADAVGRTALELMPSVGKHWFEFYGQVALTQRSNRFTQGSEALGRWFDVYATPIGDPEERQVALFFNDISERKRAEIALLQNGKRKDEFLATLAHELRNPLAPIRSTLEAMRRKASAAPALDRERGMIERHFNHLTRLTDDLLDVGRITSDKLELRMQRVSLAEVLQDAAESIRAETDSGNCVLQMQLPQEPVYLQGDPVRLTQIVMNLLKNAVKYSPPGSRISLAATLEAPEVVIQVSDQGKGISTANLPRVFEMFFQAERGLERSRGGLGIGLSLVQRLTEMHGGRVEVASAGEGMGSTFTVRLPVSCPLVLAAHGSTPVDSIQTNQPRQGVVQHVLVVDDNRDAANTLAEVLEMMGFRTDTAYDGLEGCEKAERLRPDVVVFDIGMPRLDGYQACRQLRSQAWGRDMLVLAVSGWGQKEDLKRSLDAGFDAHLVKPVMLGDLIEKIEELSAARARRAQTQA